MTKLVKFTDAGNLPANPADLIQGLQNVNANLQGTAGGVPFLRLLKSGEYAYGPENLQPTVDSLWAVNPYSIQHGYACWGDGELLGEQMVPFNQAAPNKGDLPDYGEDWDQQFSMNLQCVQGEDKGVVVLYRGTSTGLRNAAKQLIADIITQVQKDPQHIVPVLELDVDSYHHKKYGQIFYPILNIVEWVTFETGEPAEEAPEPEPEPEPRQRQRRRPAAAAPARRGRVRAVPDAPVTHADAAPPWDEDDAKQEEAPQPVGRRRRRRG